MSIWNIISNEKQKITLMLSEHMGFFTGFSRNAGLSVRVLLTHRL